MRRRSQLAIEGNPRRPNDDRATTDCRIREYDLCANQITSGVTHLTWQLPNVHRECDSPLTLTNYTLDWLDKQWSSEIDFVICRWPRVYHTHKRSLNGTCRDWWQCEVVCCAHDATFHYVAKRWNRHDNDRKTPRTTKEIYDLNRVLSKKMEDIFVKQGIPVIPSIGTLDGRAWYLEQLYLITRLQETMMSGVRDFPLNAVR